MERMILAPAVASADVLRLGATVHKLIAAGADWLHVDVTDGHFVPGITMGASLVEALRRLCDEGNVSLDVHLLVERPERMVEEFVRAGADVVTVPVEACRPLRSTLESIRSVGAGAGVSLHPGTPLASIEEVVGEVDVVTLLGSDPGSPGPILLAPTVAKLRRLRRLLDASGSAARIEVDADVPLEAATRLVGAGADVLVAGASLFTGPFSIEQNVAALRRSLEEAEAPDPSCGLL